LKPTCKLPPAGIFEMSAEAIVESLASKHQSPEGCASGLRLLRFYLSHSGKWLSASRLRRIEKAQKLLEIRLSRELRGEKAA
jgi:hypothetical protein